jgi:hypothetical protein
LFAIAGTASPGRQMLGNGKKYSLIEPAFSWSFANLLPKFLYSACYQPFAARRCAVLPDIPASSLT